MRWRAFLGVVRSAEPGGRPHTLDPVRRATRETGSIARPTCMFSLLHDAGAQYLASALFAGTLAAGAWARRKWRSRRQEEPGSPESAE